MGSTAVCICRIDLLTGCVSMSQRENLESELREAKLALKHAEKAASEAKHTLQEERRRHSEYRGEAAKTIRSLCNQLLDVSGESSEASSKLMFVPEMRQMVAHHAQLMETLESVNP